MITALVFTIVLNQAEAKPFVYAYPNEAACQSALRRADFATTGKHKVVLECRTGYNPGKNYQVTSQWQAIGVGLVANTVRILDNPIPVGTYPDENSCRQLLKQAQTKTVSSVQGMDLVTICVPKAI